MEDEIREEEELENGEEQKKIEIKLPGYLDELKPDVRQNLLELSIFCSRERFLKRARQSMKNYVASIKNILSEKGWTVAKIEFVEDQINAVQKMIDQVEKNIDLCLFRISIWTQFLEKIKGLGASTAGGIISTIGKIDRFPSISALRKYSGWYPQDGKAIRKISGAKLCYSPKLKQYLYHFVSGIMKAKDPYYYPMYLAEKERIYKIHPEYVDRKATKKQKIDGIPSHVHKMALRKVIQMFQSDLFCIWRDIEGLPPTLPYAIAVLGHEHFRNPLTENPYYKKSPLDFENQPAAASHYLLENQKRVASQRSGETQRTDANQDPGETPRSCVSQENH